ncbi:hypothetical protein BDN67DRAFT_829268 [Paxillus ammoniavirescens]|nr:hypothetical protein BDN67DRAFT_829268 [Paxillus ammoniavirescens]
MRGAFIYGTSLHAYTMHDLVYANPRLVHPPSTTPSNFVSLYNNTRSPYFAFVTLICPTSPPMNLYTTNAGRPIPHTPTCTFGNSLPTSVIHVTSALGLFTFFVVCHLFFWVFVVMSGLFLMDKLVEDCADRFLAS